MDDDNALDRLLARADLFAAVQEAKAKGLTVAQMMQGFDKIMDADELAECKARFTRMYEGEE